MTQEFVTLPREVVEQALAAMSLALSDVDWRKDSPTQPVIHKAYNATRAALEQPRGEQEPVAKVVLTEQLGLPCLQWLDLDKQFDFKGGEFLYTHPQNLRCKSTQARLATLWGYVKEQPKREPLTHYEIHELFRRSWDDRQDGDEIKAFARAIEAAHNIK